MSTRHKTRPNIVWICSDQQRFDTINSLGNKYINTPNLDRLVKEGIAFTNTYCQCPVCTPSRASFLTGRYPVTNKVRQNGQKIPENELLITKILSKNGYECALSGKLHISPCDGRIEERIDDGYKEFHWSHGPFPKWNDKNQYIYWLKTQGKDWEDVYPFSREISEKLGPEGVTPNGEIVWAGVPTKYHQTTWCFDNAIKFINKRKEKNWMISINPFDPHHPFDPPEEFLNKYNPEKLPSPKYREGELEDKPCFHKIDHIGAYGGEGISFKNTTDYQHRQITGAYYGMIELIDYNVGRLLDYLEKTGLRDNTLIIFTSDHGEMLGDHGIYLKGPYLYDPLVRVPLIVSWPKKFKKGLVKEAFIELLDVSPTILDVINLEIPERMQGKSFKELCVSEEKDEHRDYVISAYYNALVSHKEPKAYVSMYRDDNYKIIVYHGMKKGELYNLKEDPDEFSNLWLNRKYIDKKNNYLLKLIDANAFEMDPIPERLTRF